MKKIPKKNYYTLAVLIIATVLLTFSLVHIYNNRIKFVSNFYKYSNKITGDEFDEYVLENNDLIIYLSDKYDLTNEVFEMKLEQKINNFNLKDKFVFIDKNDISKKKLKDIKENYGINIDLNSVPIIIIMVDKKAIKTVAVNSKTDVNTVIEYEVFE